mmetsp:Transcript_27115/g.38408  ORF Transcript_27115/g.38408 Transcript_27115/m.38408 type:complete len:92 (+) Transcript_27115:1531-1806(+)
MFTNPLTKGALSEQEEKVAELLKVLGEDFWNIKVLAFPPADSNFPDFLYGKYSKGHLKRPRDSESRDGCVEQQTKDLIHIECKNYRERRNR